MAASGSRIAFACLVSCGAAIVASPLAAQATQRISVGTAGAEGDSYSQIASVSADGRYVAFESQATNLIPGDVNGVSDVFVHDRSTGTTILVSADSSGHIGNGDSRSASISADGRFVAFQSYASNLIPVDANGDYDVFVRDLQAGTTEWVSISAGGGSPNGRSFAPAISSDGRYVAFHSEASNLILGDTNGVEDVFVRDRVAGTSERVSVDSAGVQANQISFSAEISPDGRFVGFQSFATNLVPGDTNGQRDIFLRDRQAGTTERVNVTTGGGQVGGQCFSFAISADGRYVAFSHDSDDLVPADTNVRVDAFLRDRQADTTERISVTSGEGQADGHSYATSISDDGRYVAMESNAGNLVAGDTNSTWDVFVRDVQLGTTQRVSVDSGGAQANQLGRNPSFSAGGRWIAFQSSASNLVAGDTNATLDVFLRDRDTTAFTSLCDPGVGGVVACPCSNPASGPTRGCDNSSMTGGAALSASGTASLASDTLVFATSGEKPTALSIVLQGAGFVPGGAAYGQGMRCAGGTLRRLFVKEAVGGSIVAPEFLSGDPSVSAQSAAKGDVIQPGQPRWYLVYYRDPIVLGGCPSDGTFNATQTGQVCWTP
jgi:Tol biopolymer transport system component